AFTPQQALDRLAQQMDQVMARMQAADEQNKVYHGCGPRLNPEKDPKEWLSKDQAPWAKLDNEKPKGETVAYDELINRWTNSQEPSRKQRRDAQLVCIPAVGAKIALRKPAGWRIAHGS